MSNLTETLTVWVIESGDYEQRTVVGIAATLDAAVSHIKDKYGDPYIVDWEPLEIDHDGARCTLRGHFARVLGYSTDHVGEFDITAEELIA